MLKKRFESRRKGEARRIAFAEANFSPAATRHGENKTVILFSTFSPGPKDRPSDLLKDLFVNLLEIWLARCACSRLTFWDRSHSAI